MCGDENATPDMFHPGGGGGGGGNNNGGGGNNGGGDNNGKGDNNDDDDDKKKEDETILDPAKSSTPIPGARRIFRRGPSSIPPPTPVTSSTTPATPAAPATSSTTPATPATPAAPGTTSTLTQEVIIDFPIIGPLRGFAAQNLEQLPSLSSLWISGNYQNIIRLLRNYYEFTVTHSYPNELYCENVSGLIEMVFMNWHLNQLNCTAVEVTCSVSFMIA